MPFDPNEQHTDNSAAFESGLRPEDERPGEGDPLSPNYGPAARVARGLIAGALTDADRAALAARGISLNGLLGRECEEMRKYFGAGTGTYVAVADFGNARSFAQKVTDDGAERIIKALDAANWRLVPQNRWARFLDLFRR